DKMTERWGVGSELRMLRFLGVARTGAEVEAAETFEDAVRVYLDQVLAGFDLAAVDALVDMDAESDAVGSLVHLCVVGAVDDLAVTVHETPVEGDTAQARATVTGTFARTMWRARPTGAEVSFPLTVSLTGEGAWITSVSLDYDLEEMARVLDVSTESPTTQ